MITRCFTGVDVVAVLPDFAAAALTGTDDVNPASNKIRDNNTNGTLRDNGFFIEDTIPMVLCLINSTSHTHFLLLYHITDKVGRGNTRNRYNRF